MNRPCMALSGRGWRCVGVLALFFIIYLLYEPLKPHVTSVGMLVRNRYINQAFLLAPPLPLDLLNGTSLVLYWTPFFNRVSFGGFGNKPFATCPVNACVATNDRSYLDRARALVFHGADISMWDRPARRLQHQLYVYFSQEAPVMLDNPLGELKGAFNLTMTYRRDSDVFMPYSVAVPTNGSDVAGDDGGVMLPLLSTEPRAAWVVSHCTTISRREDYVAQLRRYIPVDQYGACGGDRCPHRDILTCYRHLARTHIFYLAFENSLCADYVTEKFYHALTAGMIPVVRGASRDAYAALAWPGSFVHVDDFAGPRQLAEHLHRLARNATALTEMTAWRRHYRFEYGSSWCSLCARIRRRDEGGGTAVYRDLSKWWYADSHCHS